MKKEIKSLLKETGVSYNDPLTSFLYELMRDHLPAGTVATIAMNCPRHTLTRYCNGHLAIYAHRIANELVEHLPVRGIHKKMGQKKKA